MSTMSSLLTVLLTSLYVSNGDLSDSQKSNLLDFHNQYRSMTAQGNQPCASGYGNSDDTTCPAGTLQKLKWDSGLANTAQAYAEDLVSRYTSCGLDHSSSSERSTWLAAETTSFGYTSGYIGENLAVAGGGRTPTQTCTGWVVGESEYFIYGENEPSVQQYTDASGRVRYAQIGHHTQVVSQYTEYVGCGCADGDDNECGASTLFCVCHYYPGGNCNGCGGIDYTRYPYPNDGACNSCDSGDSCSSSTDYLCDDGADDGLGNSGSTPSGDGSNPSPTDRPTPEPTVEIILDDGSDDGTSGTDGVVLSSGLGGLNGLAFPAITDQYPSLTKYVYGPAEAYGYFLGLVYTGGNWYLLDKNVYDDDGYVSWFAYCTCSDCEVYNCGSWNRYVTGVSTTSAAYSVTSSNDKDKNELVEGLLIGLGIAVGIFLISLAIYWCVKRKNSAKSKYNVVEMNNEISDHDYVNMGN